MKTEMFQRIYLLGFMGVGKSTIGAELAQRLGWQFADLDQLISETAGRTIPDIFETNGEEFFRKLERDILRSTATAREMVFATGGGTPCFYDNMQWMNANGLTVFLEAALPLLVERLSSSSDRPMLNDIAESDRLAFISSLLAQRTKWYQQAGLHHSVFGDVERDISNLLSALSNLSFGKIRCRN